MGFPLARISVCIIGAKFDIAGRKEQMILSLAKETLGNFKNRRQCHKAILEMQRNSPVVTQELQPRVVVQQNVMFGGANFLVAQACTDHLAATYAPKSGNTHQLMVTTVSMPLIARCVTQQMSWRQQDCQWSAQMGVLYMVRLSNQKIQLSIITQDFLH